MTNTLKGIFKNSSVFTQLCVVLFLVITGSIIASLLFIVFVFLKTGFSTVETMEAMKYLAERADCLREAQLFQSLGMFLFPAIVVSNLFSDDQKDYPLLKTETPPLVFLLTVLSMIAFIPFLNLTVFLNGSIHFPEFLKPVEDWLQQQEVDINNTVELMLNTKNIGIILLNFVIVGVLAAVGEEFIFRGVLQNIFKKTIKNHHLVIWIVAFIFSAIHMQFSGFIARMLLGAYLGYLLYYTQNIWVPVLAHFTNNALSLSFYYTKDSSPAINSLDTIGADSTWPYAVASFSIWAFLFFLIVKQYKSKNLTS